MVEFGPDGTRKYNKMAIVWLAIDVNTDRLSPLDPHEKPLGEVVDDTFQDLSEMEREITKMRAGVMTEYKTQLEAARALKRSPRTIRAIEDSALNKLRQRFGLQHIVTR